MSVTRMGAPDIKVIEQACGVSFGSLSITPKQSIFYNELNEQILHLCKSLPDSVQTDALLLLLADARGSWKENTDFFKHYPEPSWSIVFWLIELATRLQFLTEQERRQAIEAHALAMFLHAVDDHLNDGDIDLNHLTLLLRSQAWLRMHTALNSLAQGVPKGKEIISGFIDQYYASIQTNIENISLDQYCERFRSQMGTAYIVPGLLIKKISSDSDFYDSVLTSFGSFGIAWRLVDDLNDIKPDMVKNRHTAIYCCLDGEYKMLWDAIEIDRFETNTNIHAICNHLQRENILKPIQEKIYCEMESAATAAGQFGLIEFANELRLMCEPITTATIAHLKC